MSGLAGIRIAVIGGGIGGLAASIALRNAGFLETQVFERATRLEAAGSGLVLTPNGVKALDGLGRGIGAAVRRYGHSLPAGAEQPFLMPDGRVISTSDLHGSGGRQIVLTTGGDLEARFGAPQVTIRRRDLLRVLIEAHGEVGLHAGVELIDVRDRGPSVRARFAGSREARFDLLVGADGPRSTVRRLIDAAPPRCLGFVTVRGISRGVDVPRELAEGFNLASDGIIMCCSSLGEGEWYWSVAVRSGPYNWPRDPAQARAAALDRLPSWPSAVPGLVSAATEQDLLVEDAFERPSIPSWSRNRVTLLGDAAHLIAPFLGQGASMALEDAIVLARSLTAETSLGGRLAAYEGERNDRTARVAEVSAEIGREGTATARQGGFDFIQFQNWLYGYASEP